jgi:hypothetical protein
MPNIGTKQSHFITYSQLVKMYRSYSIADELGFPLNHCITLRLGNAMDAGLAFRDYTTEWLTYNVGIAALVWSLERPGNKANNLHINIQFSLIDDPDYLSRFRAVADDWRTKLGLPVMIGDSRTLDIFRCKYPRETLAYICKGCDPAIAQRFNIQHPDKRDQGIIDRKRCGYSEAISPAKQRRISNMLEHTS